MKIVYTIGRVIRSLKKYVASVDYVYQYTAELHLAGSW